MIPTISALWRKLTLASIGRFNACEKLAFTVLQGLANRKAPQVYLVEQFAESDFQYRFTRILQEQGVILTQLEDAWKLFSMFKEDISGLIVYDAKMPSSIDIAIAICSKEKLIPVTEKMAEEFTAEFGFGVVDDLRGKWDNDAEAHEWAYDKLWPEFRRDIFGFLMYAGEINPPDQLPITSWSSYPYPTVDYMVQNEIFPYTICIKNIEGDFRNSMPLLTEIADVREVSVCEKYLGDLPYNIPSITGFNISIGEHHSVGLLSAYGIFSIPEPGPNLSVHTATRNLQGEEGLTQMCRLKREDYGTGRLSNKVYVTFILSDGDNLGTYPVKFFKQWMEPQRGQVPIAWSLSALAFELMPGITRYFYETATPNDYHVAACSGLGYMKPVRFGERLGFNRETMYKEYLALTGYYMEQLDMHEIWPINTDNAARELFAKKIPGVNGVFADFTPAETYEESIEIYHDVPSFRCLVGPWGSETPGDDGFMYADWIAKEIKRKTPKTRPAFMFVGLNGWSSGPGQLLEIMEHLGEEYVAVRPDQFISMFRNGVFDSF